MTTHTHDSNRKTVRGEAPRESISLGGDAFHDALADVLRQAGSETFYNGVAQLLAKVVDCNKWLVMRYAAYDKPVFLVNQAMTESACDFYLKGLYRLDPLNRLAREEREPRVVTIHKAGDEPVGDKKYLTEIFRSAFIFDELAILLPALGGITVAICCERARRRFQQADIDKAHSILSLLDAVHRTHLERIFTARAVNEDTHLSMGNDDAILIIDKGAKRIFATEQWRQLEANLGHGTLLHEHVQAETAGHIQLSQSHVLHWEPLDSQFALAPDGTILTIEVNAPDIAKPSAHEAVSIFQTLYKLTPREAEIIQLVLVGLPNERIADQLGLTIGTVKNHRWRLYNKLDITSERELFYLFLSAVLNVDVGNPGDASPEPKNAAEAVDGEPVDSKRKLPAGEKI